MKSLLKPLLLGFILFILLVPLSMIESLVRERAHNRTIVSNDIAQTDTRPQQVHGPWLVIEYSTTAASRPWNLSTVPTSTPPVAGSPASAALIDRRWSL